MTLPLPELFRSRTTESLGTSEAERLFAALDNGESPVSIRFNPYKIGSQPEGRQVPWCRYGYYLDERPQFTLDPAFHGGAYYVQEASSMFLEAIFRQIFEPDAAPRILDLCAAPGGKSATLAQYMENKGTLVSCDAAQNRLTLVGGALERLGVACGRVLHNDAAVYNEAFAGADAVLCDVPCSGLGVLAKKPDIRQKTLDGLDGLVRLQRAILETAARYVRPGGRLVYSTCTLNPDENAGIVRPFLKEHPEFRTRSVECVLPGTTKDDDFLTLYPFRTGTDGFFIASLERL